MVQAERQVMSQKARLNVSLVKHQDELEQVLRLRYSVFVEEAKNLRMLNESGLERDQYDEYCDHLIVKDMETDQAVGTYRLLPGDRAMDHIGFYSQTEFDLRPFSSYQKHALELGRSCVHPDYRKTNAIQLLWEEIAEYTTKRGYLYLIGSASVPFCNLEESNFIYTYLKQKKVITDRFGIQPLEDRKLEGLEIVESNLSERQLFRKLPPLMKGYQWLGAEIAGDPAYDQWFQTMVFFIFLEKDRVTRKYKKRFLRT